MRHLLAPLIAAREWQRAFRSASGTWALAVQLRLWDVRPDEGGKRSSSSDTLSEYTTALGGAGSTRELPVLAQLPSCGAYIKRLPAPALLVNAVG